MPGFDSGARHCRVQSQTSDEDHTRVSALKLENREGQIQEIEFHCVGEFSL